MSEPPAPPSFRDVMSAGLPCFAREGLLPLGLFYLGLRLGGLALGIALSTGAALAAYGYEVQRGRRGLMARLSLVFLIVQAAVGLASQSAVVFLAQPVLLNVGWGVAYLASAAIGRPLAGTLADAWYPIPADVHASRTFRRVFGRESVVWGIYLLSRGGVRLAVLLLGGLGAFFVVVVATGLPVMLPLIAWSVWYAVRAFQRSEELGPVAVPQPARP